MITAQDIREKGFEKVRIGGYDMASVDDFLEEIADDITASQKENAVLKSKIKVLVDKVEEYRANEEALNMAVLSAQKLAVQIEADARSRAATIISEADAQANATVGSIEERAAAAEKRLEDAKAATAKLLETVSAMCSTQITNIQRIAAGYAPAEENTGFSPADEAPLSGAEADAARITAEDVTAYESAPVKPGTAARQRRLDSTQPFSL